MSDDFAIERAPLVQTKTHGAVTLIRLNLPDKRNALVETLREALIAALEQAQHDSACRAVVLTGSGTSFCAGGDLDGLRDHEPLNVRARMQRGQQLIRLIAAGDKPVIAAVNGAAHGAGLSIAAACDFVVASRAAKFGAVFGKLGLMADFGLLWTLPRRIGMAQTRRVLFSSRVLDAQEAHALGLADQLAEPADLIADALALAQSFSESAPVAVAMTKAALAKPVDSLDAALALELEGQTLLFSTDDFVEGRSAFRERRPPRFQGR
ncbi:enoyl-CoA hydratase/isomerase family protein [Paraburkholderia phymatum]|uniref:enoyl-CoA hydratase/isomerase family protein n=1 Tax=Paraburkholderia phymatum TaxID=148447 RepID=UPI00317319BD